MYDQTKEHRMLKLLDFNQMFSEAPDPILLNRIDYTSKDYANKLTSRLYSRSGELNFVVSCDCGNLTGNYYEKVRCSKCNTIARSDFSPNNRLMNEAWLSMPDNIPGVLHPVFYLVLSRWLKYSKQKDVNYIDTILNPKLELPEDLKGVITGRGHQYFYDNFDRLMSFFLHEHKGTRTKKLAAYIPFMLAKYRHLVFCRYLPVLSNLLHTITSDGGKYSKKYADESSKYILQAAIDLSCLENSSARHRTSAEAEAIIHGVYKDYIQYVKDGIIDRLAHKESLVRRHIFGARFHWSFRSVIVPICGAHSYDELHLPWCIGVNLLKIHIIGRLMKQHGLMYHKAIEKQARAVVNYDKDIDQIIQDLIRESPEKGLPVLWNRNPTLKRGSIQKLFVTKVKKDTNDQTVAMSVLVLKDPNADFDGDALNGVLIIENEMSRKYEVLHPGRRILSTNSPGMGENISLPNQTLLVANKFLGQV